MNRIANLGERMRPPWRHLNAHRKSFSARAPKRAREARALPRRSRR